MEGQRSTPLASSLGRVGAAIRAYEVGGRRFEDIPVVWQDWSLWQLSEAEREYGSVFAWQALWLGIDGEVDPETQDPREQAAQLAEKARRLQEQVDGALSGSDPPKSENPGYQQTTRSPLMLLGTYGEGAASVQDQAFYAYVLLAPYDSELDEAARMAGPSRWRISPEWIKAHLTPFMLQMLLAQVLIVQYEAAAGELEGEADADSQSDDQSSAESDGNGS